MTWYRIAGQDIYFPISLQEVESFKHPTPMPAPVLQSLAPPHALISRTQGWVGGEMRDVQTWSAISGKVIKVSGVGDFHIDHDHILRMSQSTELDHPWTDLECEAALGAALVLSLSMHETWCLHASATQFKGQVTAFVGESGQGKSTLADALARAGWQLVTDDILPVARSQAEVQAWPRFPQLKLTVQPGLSLAEQMPLHRVCVLTQAEHPQLRLLSAGEALQVLLGHTAGARLFEPSLLARHMAFCAWAVTKLQVYELAYPRTWEALPEVKELLEDLC